MNPDRYILLPGFIVRKKKIFGASLPWPRILTPDFQFFIEKNVSGAFIRSLPEHYHFEEK